MAGLFLLGRQLGQGAQRGFVPLGVERAVFFEDRVDFHCQDVSHEVEDFVTLIPDQGQLIEGGLGRGRVVAFDLVFDRFDQGVFGERFFVAVVVADTGVGSLMAGSSRKGRQFTRIQEPDAAGQSAVEDL